MMKFADLFPPSVLGPALLAQAKYNLANKYHLVGLVDRMPEFEDLVAKKLGWQSLNLRDNSKVTRNRPTTLTIEDHQKKAILRHNQLDVHLYHFAQKLIAGQVHRNNGNGAARLKSY